MAWWFDNVLDPYLARTEDLYAQAQAAEARGLSPSPYYNQIRQFSNAQAPTYKGKPVPQVEEVFFGNKSLGEQDASVLKWRTRPLSWLSTFQLGKVGTYSAATREFLGAVSAYDEQYYNYINQNAVTGDALDRLKAARSAILLAEAQKAGPEAVQAFMLNEAEPYVRLSDGGFGLGNAYWAQSTQAAGQVVDILVAAGLSPRGFSADAIRYKSSLYASIEAARGQDPTYNALWVRLSDIMPLPNGTRLAVTL